MGFFDGVQFKEHTGLTRYQFIEYILKCVFGVAGTFILFIIFPQYRDSLYWVIISLILSITYNNDSKAAFDRMKGNTIGPLIGLGSYFLKEVLDSFLPAISIYTSLVAVIVGMLFVILFCSVLKIIEVVRTAIVGFFIVMIYEDDHHSWQGAIMRMIGVLIGCVLGLLINKIFSWLSKKLFGKYNTPSRKVSSGDE